MTLTLVFLAVLMAAFVGWLLRQSIEATPWVADSGQVAALRAPPPGHSAERVALVVFLAVVTSVFALTISAYMMRMALSAEWQFLPQPRLAWVNTGFLVLGSVALQIAWTAARREHHGAFWAALALGGGFTLAFILGQYAFWRELAGAGFYASAYVGSAFFAMMTGLHAVHLLGGLVALARVVHRVRRGEPLAQIREGIALCAVYWHYLLVVWLLLFAVLFVGAVPLYDWCRSVLI